MLHQISMNAIGGPNTNDGHDRHLIHHTIGEIELYQSARCFEPVVSKTFVIRHIKVSNNQYFSKLLCTDRYQFKILINKYIVSGCCRDDRRGDPYRSQGEKTCLPGNSRESEFTKDTYSFPSLIHAPTKGIR